jgi:hypothetical protein
MGKSILPGFPHNFSRLAPLESSRSGRSSHFSDRKIKFSDDLMSIKRTIDAFEKLFGLFGLKFS